MSKQDVRSFLIENGMSDLDANDTVSSVYSSVVRENRRHGCLQLVTGIGMLTVGGIALLEVAIMVRTGPSLSVTGGTEFRLALVGGVMAFLGFLAICLGLVSMGTGKS